MGLARLEMLPPRRHSFTHFHLDIDAALLHLAKSPGRLADTADSAWVDPAAPGDLGLPAPIRRLLDDADGRLRQGGADDRTHDNGESQ
jgi:A/G-specific adenine glycosylase